MSIAASEARMRVLKLLHASTPRPDRQVMHVSDLVAICQRKNYWDRYVSKVLPVGDIGGTRNLTPALIKGQAIHYFLEKQGRRHYPDDKYELKLSLDMATGKPWSKQTDTPNSMPLVGSADAVINIDNAVMMMDFKTCEELPNKVKESHAQQLLVYKYMYEKLKLGTINAVVVVYVPTKTFFPDAFEITQKGPIEQYIMSDVHEWYSASIENPPHRKLHPPSWLCGECPHVERCAEVGL